MSDFIWPATAVIISTIFFLIFKEPLSTLVKRTKSISKDGFDASDDVPGEPAAQAGKTDLAEIQRVQKAHAESIEQLTQQITGVHNRVAVLESLPVLKQFLDKRAAKNLDAH